MAITNKKKIIFLSCLLLLFTFGDSAFSQPTISLQLAPSLELAQVIYVSDFGFVGDQVTKFLFQITIDNSGEPEVQGVVILELFHDEGLVADAATQPFTLPANAFLSASNLQLTDGYTIPGTGEVIKLDPQTVNYPTDEFENEVFTGNRLEKGTYKAILSFCYNNGQSQVSAPPQTITVNNPTFIRPITPGTTTRSGYQEILYTQFPTFQFETDFDETLSMEPPYHVQVYKKLDQNSSVDEVLNNQPHFDQWQFETNFQYPPAAVLPLTPGVYLWRIELRYLTSSGTETIPSPIAEFRVEDPSTLGQIDDQGVKDQLLQILIDVLGEKRGREIALSVSDYNLIDIRLNGQSITTQEFYEILEGYEGEVRKISDISLYGTQQ